MWKWIEHFLESKLNIQHLYIYNEISWFLMCLNHIYFFNFNEEWTEIIKKEDTHNISIILKIFKYYSKELISLQLLCLSVDKIKNKMHKIKYNSRYPVVSLWHSKSCALHLISIILHLLYLKNCTFYYFSFLIKKINLQFSNTSLWWT